MERCPGCNSRLRGKEICSRCKADLRTVIGSEQLAQFWLQKSILFWEEEKIQQCIGALEFSIHLKKTNLAFVYREFLIEQTCQDILELLAKKRLLTAKKHLYLTKGIHSCSPQLQHLQMFTDYLLIQRLESNKD